MKNEAILSKVFHSPAIPWSNRYNSFFRFLMEGAFAGIVAGFVGVAFRLALTTAEMWRNHILVWARTIPHWGWLILPVLAALAGGFAGRLTAFAPETAGSGIPHVEAVLLRQRRLVWWRVIPVKFFAGALAIGAGMSLGREGPTVQMGAAAGQAVSKSLMRNKTEELQLIACGAGAGLAAAFNAPLAGSGSGIGPPYPLPVERHGQFRPGPLRRFRANRRLSACQREKLSQNTQLPKSTKLPPPG